MKVNIGNYRKNKDRKVNVKIHDHDVFDAYITLGYIILPVLKEVKKHKNGSPFVDNEDVPENLRLSKEETDYMRINGDQNTPDFEEKADKKFHQRWDYVIDEMIFAFESLYEDWVSQFWSGKPDYYFSEPDENNLCEYVEGPNNTLKCDTEGLKKYQNRIDNGFRLFGKYYQNLWT